MVTASGRQVRARVGGLYGESLLSGQALDRDTPMTGEYERSELSDEPGADGRATRSGARPRGTSRNQAGKRKHIDTYNSLDDMDDEDEAESSVAEWDNPDGDDDAGDDLAEDEEDFGESSDGEDEPKSLVVRLKLPRAQIGLGTSNHALSNENTSSTPTFNGNGNLVASASTADPVEPPTSVQRTATFPERLISQVNKPVYPSQPQSQVQASISTYFQPTSNG